MALFSLRSFVGALFFAGIIPHASAASFNIQGISPVAAVRGTSPPGMEASFTVTAAGSTEAWTASLESAPAWASLNAAAGTGAGALMISFNTTALAAGTYNTALTLNSGGTVSRQAVTLTVITPRVGQMEADLNRPAIYALHQGSWNQPGYLIFLNTDTETVEKVLPLDFNAVHFDFSNAEQLLYVARGDVTEGALTVIDPVARKQVRVMNTDVSITQVHAAKSGRLVTQSFHGRTLRNSATGARISGSEGYSAIGDAHPDGNHFLENSEGASDTRLTLLSLAGDRFTTAATGGLQPYSYGAPFFSGDANRIFRGTGIHDSALQPLLSVNEFLLAATYRGEIVFGRSQAFHGATGAVLSNMPVIASVAAVSGDQKKLFQFNNSNGTFHSTLMTVFGAVPPPVSAPTPADGGIVSAPLDRLRWSRAAGAQKYRVFLGTDSAAVAAADLSSPLYLGETTEPEKPLTGPLTAGTPYFWRLDAVKPGGPVAGPVWTFTRSALTVTPQALTVNHPRGAPAVKRTLALSGAAWTAAESLPWLELSAASGASGTPLELTFLPAGLAAGRYSGDVRLTSGGTTAAVPVTFQLFDPELNKMTADPSRPWIYALHPGTAEKPGSYVLFVNATTGVISETREVGSGATDLTINHQEGKLYVSNWRRRFIQVIDLESRNVLSPIPSGSDVYKLNAGRAGRIYAEEQDQWIHASILNSATGAGVGDTVGLREGDAEIDPSGRFYYHCDNNISNAHITKYDISADKWTQLADSAYFGGYGSRNLVLSPDGGRLFWTGRALDTDLKVLRDLGAEVYATTQRGELAVTDRQILNAANGAVLASLPVTTTVSAVAGDQSAIVYFNPSTKRIGTLPMSSIATVPGPNSGGNPPNNAVRLSPVPELSWNVIPAALKYRVFFGASAAAVAAATTASAEYLGETPDNRWLLTADRVPPNGTFFWRVDAVGLTTTATGSVLTFQTPAATVTPTAAAATGIRGAPPMKLTLPVSGVAGATWTASTTGAAWLRVVTPSGTTPGTLELELSPGTLAAGAYSGRVTFTANGKSDSIPVSFTVEPQSFIALKADPARPRLYAIQRYWPVNGPPPAVINGSLAVLHSGTGAIERVIPLTENPTGLDLTPDNRFLYAVTTKGRTMHRIDLDDWSTAVRPLAASQDSDSTPNSVWYRVAAGTGTKVFWVDGQWAPRLHSMDFATGLETAEPVLAKDDYGFGAIAWTDAGARLIGSSQYGWSAGNIYSSPVSVDVSGATPAVTASDFPLLRDPLDAPVVVRPEVPASILIKKHNLSAALTAATREYPGEIYAATRTRGIVFGASAAWRENTMTQVWQAPEGVHATVSAVAGDQSAFFYFDRQAAKLVRVPMSTLGDVPGPAPEDGEVVSSMPATLTWTPNPQAARYEVYFGTDRAGVGAAAGVGSPFHIGTAATASLALEKPFATAGLWWWRVDTVLPDGTTVKGPVWHFSGALKFVASFSGPVGNYSPAAPALVIEGGTLVAGFPEAGSNAGEVHIFEKLPGTEQWKRAATPAKPAGASAAAKFGAAAALRGDILWIGAPGDGTGGKVHEYRRDGSTAQWTATGRSVVSATTAGGNQFGLALVFDGSTLFVASPLATSGGQTYSGMVEVFDAATLARKGTLSPATAAYSNQYGKTMALGDGFLAVGVPNRYNSATGRETGAVEIWTPRPDGVWVRSSTLTAPSADNILNFGASVAASGDRLFVGTLSASAGVVYPYQKGAGTAWTRLERLARAGIPRTDSYGSALAARGDLLATAAPDYSSSYAPFISTTWLHRRSAAAAWTPVAPALPRGADAVRAMGWSLALTERYLVASHLEANGYSPGFSIHLHNPAGNLPPSLSVAAQLHAEEGVPYRFPFIAEDDNPDDTLTLSALTPLPAWLTLRDDGGGAGLLSGTPPAGSAGLASFRLQILDSAGAATVKAFDLRILPPGGIPRITESTGDLTVQDGHRAEFRVTVAGDPAEYQWYFQDRPLTGETRNFLVIPRAQASDAGSYQVRVTRGGVPLDSAPMLLTINQTPDRFGGDWPTLGAGNSHSGAYPATLGRHKFLPAWTAPDAGANQVATGNGRVYATVGRSFTSGNVIQAYDLLTGAKIWTFPLPASHSTNPPSYHRGRIYMQRGKDGADQPELICVDAATGSLAWRSPFSAQWETYAAPVVTDDAVFINGGYYGGMYGFGLDGTQLFFRELAQEDRWTPLFHKDRLYTCLAGVFREHDPRMGSDLWKVTALNGAYSASIAVAEGNSAVVTGNNSLSAVNLDTTVLRWTKTGYFPGLPAIRDGTVYAIVEGGVQTHSLLTGEKTGFFPTLTASNQPATPIHQPVVLDDMLLISDTANIWAFDLATRALRQRLDNGGPLTYTDGVLLATGADQTLRAWKVNQPAILAPATPALAAVEDVTTQWDVTVADPDADTVTASVTGLPSWLTMTKLAGGMLRFTGTPRNEHAGAFTFSVTADDAKSFPTSLQIQGSVRAVNDRPIAVTPAPILVDEDSAVPPADPAALFSDEEDGFAGLTVTVAGNTNQALFADAAISGGKLRLTLTPDASGTAVIRLLATDSGGLSAETELAVTVRAVNDTPGGALAPLAFDEDAPAAEIILDDFFGDVETPVSGLTFTAVSATPGIAAAELSGHTLRVTPAPDAFGAVMITVRCQDPEGAFIDTPTLVTIRPINDIPAVTLPDHTVEEDAAAFTVNLPAFASDVETPDELLRFSAVSSAPETVAATLSGQVLTLAPQPDANGECVITVTCRDTDDGVSEFAFHVTVKPVNDPPIPAAVLPDISAGPAAADADVDFRPFASDADTGDTLTWRVVSNTNPALFTKLEFDGGGRLLIRYAPYTSGEATITVEVADAAGSTAQQSFRIDLPPPTAPSITTASVLTLNRQTGLWEQRVTVKNTAARDIGGFEVSVSGLPADASLHNASGGSPPGSAVGFYSPMAVGESVTLVLEYYSPGRSLLTPVLTVGVVPLREAAASASLGDITIDRAVMLEPGAFLIEFTAVPGGLYQVQYSNGLTGWKDSPVRIRAAANRVQWIDRGMPRTNTAPSSSARFYRVKHLSAP